MSGRKEPHDIDIDLFWRKPTGDNDLPLFKKKNGELKIENDVNV